MEEHVKQFAHKYVKMLLVGVMCAITFGLAQAQEVKMGYVNADRIMNEATPAKKAQKKLQSEFAKRAKELHELQTQLKDTGERLERDIASLSDADRLSRQKELAQLSQQYQLKQRAYREDFMRRHNEEIAKVIDRVNKAIEKIAKTNGFDIIVQDAAYFSPRCDITDKVLKAVNQ